MTDSINTLAQSPVIAYVTEEVWRQGHEVARLDGIERVGWMLDAWSLALIRAAVRKPNMEDMVALGKRIERVKNKYGIRDCSLRVGPRTCPHPDRVPGLLVTLFEQRDKLSPLDFYKEFELIHPFEDGNGRTGKILLNWLSGTLVTPFFPPADLFGTVIRNP